MNQNPAPATPSPRASIITRIEETLKGPAALIGLAVTFAGAASAAWAVAARWFGIDTTLMFGTLVERLPWILAYAVALAVNAWLVMRARISGQRLFILYFATMFIVISVIAYQDLRIRMRLSLVDRQLSLIRDEVCLGDRIAAAKVLSSLLASPRYHYLGIELKRQANYNSLLNDLSIKLSDPADGVTLIERRMLLGSKYPLAKPKGLSSAVWEKWRQSMRARCS